MTQGLLRRLVMWTIFVGHILAIGLCFALISNFDSALGVALCLAPLTATIFMFIVQFHDENFYGTETNKKLVSVDAASLTIVLSVVLVATIILLTWGYHTARIGSVETLQKGVSLVDSGIAVYLTILLRRLFERNKD